MTSSTIYNYESTIDLSTEYVDIVNATDHYKIVKVIYGSDDIGFTAEIIPTGRYRICMCNVSTFMKQEISIRIVKTGVTLHHKRHGNHDVIGILPEKTVTPLSILSSLSITKFGPTNFFRIRRFTRIVKIPVSLMFMPYEWHGMYAYKRQVLCNEEDCED